MRLQSLGDQAVLAHCADENDATRLAAHARRAAPSWCIDIVQAYTSVALFYDFRGADFPRAAAWIESLQADSGHDARPGTCHEIPCCYEFGLDFEPIRKQTGLDRETVIALHSGTIYTVYAIGFCPGFPYLGYLPERLSGVPRLASPRLKVEAGSVGLTGRQTGIYTERRPGGWNIVGQTPFALVDVEDEYFPLRTGDQVRFRRVDEKEFEELKGMRLPKRDACGDR